MSEKDTFYNPEVWKTTYLGEFEVLPRQVEFDGDEVRMIREMSWKTGCPRGEVIREAVRRLYDYIMYGGGSRDSRR